MTESHQKGHIDVKALYGKLIAELGFEATDSEGRKLRQHPRFSFDSPDRTILVEIDDFNCMLKDVSVGGVSFRSKFNFSIGRQLILNVDRKFRVKTNVVRVVREEREDPDDEDFFLHGCKFTSENDGYRCTVLVLNILLAMIRQKEPQQA